MDKLEYRYHISEDRESPDIRYDSCVSYFDI